MAQLILTQTERGKQCIVNDNYVYRFSHVLKKSGNATWRCCQDKCSARIETNSEVSEIVHYAVNHNHEADARKAEKVILRAKAKKQADDVTVKPSRIIQSQLESMEESSLQTTDLRNVTQSVHRARRKNQPAQPKCRADVHRILQEMNVKTSKGEQFVLCNDEPSGIIIFGTKSNLKNLCCDVDFVLIDGTFKSCPKYFYQLYTFHGGKGNTYVPLLYALLPSKTEQCYTKLWDFVFSLCTQNDVTFTPRAISVDFERAMINVIQAMLPNTRISACRFHLGQSFWRKIQEYGLSPLYKNKDTEESKWLTKCFGLSFLEPVDAGYAFAEDIMNDEMPENSDCERFANYLTNNYIDTTASFPPELWAATPNDDVIRTNNAAESFHAHLNGQFYSHHPTIFILLDVLKKLQATTYVKARALLRPSNTNSSTTNYAQKQYEKYRNGDITRASFITAMGYKFKALN